MRKVAPLAFVLAIAGCNRSGRETRVGASLIVPIELAGPTCDSQGPSVSIEHARRVRCGKGDTCTILDLHVRNPSDHTLWLLLDARDEFSGYLESVSILHAKTGQSPPVWEFSGQNQHQGVRVPVAADVVARGIEFFGKLERYPAVFLNRIALDYDRHLELADATTTLPARGDFDLSWLNDAESHALFPLDGRERVSLDVWCTSEIPVKFDEAAGE